jgi:hypothetical protein
MKSAVQRRGIYIFFFDLTKYLGTEVVVFFTPWIDGTNLTGAPKPPWIDGKDYYFIGELNCACVGITTQLHLTPIVAQQVPNLN